MIRTAWIHGKMVQRNISIRLFLVCFPLFSLIFSTSSLVVSISSIGGRLET